MYQAGCYVNYLHVAPGYKADQDAAERYEPFVVSERVGHAQYESW